MLKHNLRICVQLRVGWGSSSERKRERERGGEREKERKRKGFVADCLGKKWDLRLSLQKFIRLKFCSWLLIKWEAQCSGAFNGLNYFNCFVNLVAADITILQSSHHWNPTFADATSLLRKSSILFCNGLVEIKKKLPSDLLWIKWESCWSTFSLLFVFPRAFLSIYGCEK